MSADLIDAYLAGLEELRSAVRGMSREQLLARPVPGTWSTLEVLCHLADSEAVFADRMKRILAEDRPPLPFADPKLFVPALAYMQRDADVEIGLIEMTRRQMASILQAVPPECMQRTGIHSKDGPRTLEQVLEKAVSHLAHHLKFVREKRRAMLLPADGAA